MDNYYNDCPALMSDARIFTDYRSSTQRDESIKYINGISNNEDYRKFLQNNASNIIFNIFDEINKKERCMKNECIHTSPTRVPIGTFAEERQRYNELSQPANARKQIYTCQVQKDYTLLDM